MFAINHVPAFSTDKPTTGCCPPFDSAKWDGETFIFNTKPFIKITTRSFLYMPIGLGRKMARAWKEIEEAGADDKEEFVMLSHDLSPWKAEHFLSVSKPVNGLQNVHLSGEFKAKVFEGPYRDTGKWAEQMIEEADKAGDTLEGIYFYYATCPKCAKFYGKNYVVGFNKIEWAS